MICNVRSLKTQINTSFFLEDIISTSNKVLNDIEFDVAEWILLLRISTCETVQCYIIYTVESWFLNIVSRAMSKKKLRPVRYCMQICKVVYEDILERQTVKYTI